MKNKIKLKRKNILVNKIYFNNLFKFSFTMSAIGSILIIVELILRFYAKFLEKFYGFNYLKNTSFYKNYFNTDLSAYPFRIILILFAISIIMFFIWSLINIFYQKKNLNFVLNIVPINLIGIIDLYLLISATKTNIFRNNIINKLVFPYLIYLSLFLIPIINRKIKKKCLYKYKF